MVEGSQRINLMHNICFRKFTKFVLVLNLSKTKTLINGAKKANQYKNIL